jgi:hypothetical protein
MGYAMLLTINGVQRLKDEEYTDYGELAGLKFIRLRNLKNYAARTELLYDGFQSAVITKVESQNGIRYACELSKLKETGEPGAIGRPLNFVPDAKNGIPFGYVIDTPFNRKVLASAMNGPDCEWEIVDAKVREEIEVLADQLAETLPKGPSKEELNLRMSKQLEAKEAALAEMKKKMDDIQVIKESVVAVEKSVAEAPLMSQRGRPKKQMFTLAEGQPNANNPADSKPD